MRKILQNKVFIFILSRYFSYFLQFVNALVVAYVLGPYFLGIWGFLLLILNYLNFGNFGIELALNVRLSTGEFSDKTKQTTAAANAILLTFYSSLLYFLIGGILIVFEFPIFEKYEFSRFVLPVTLIACLNFFNVIFLNICRAYSVYAPISFFQTAVQLLQLPVFFFFKDIELVWMLLFVMVFAHFISLIYFKIKLPFQVVLKADWPVMKDLLSKGISLLTYTLTFYILMLSTRSLVGYFYPVESMGLFTFAANLASALIVGLSSLEFVLFPKMLNRFSYDNLSEKSLKVFSEVRYLYMSTAFFAVIVGLLGYPVLLLFFSEYSETWKSFTFLVMSQVIISAGFGYGTLIVSRGKERFLIVHGIIALIINLTLSVGSFYFLKLNYEWMAAFLVLAFLYYDFMVVKKGRSMLGMNSGFFETAKDLLPARFLIPLLLILTSAFSGYYLLFNICALLVFIIMNLKVYQLLRQYVKTLFHEPSIIDIENG